jgi:hypothetical protein
MSDIFHEIDEDIRRERLGHLWKRFGPYVIALAVLFVAGIGGWRAWEYYSAQQAIGAGERYEAALALAVDGKQAEAEASFQALAKDAPSGYRLLSRFRAASEIAQRDQGAGVGAFEAISEDASIPDVLRDLARIRAAFLLVDTGSQADVASRAAPLAAPGNSWRHAAREALALAAWKAGNVAETRRWAEELIADAEAPGETRARGQLLLDLAAGAEAPPAPAPAPVENAPAAAPAAAQQ